MPLAVTLRLDRAGTARIEAMQTAPAHPPHITLAIFTDDVDAATLAPELSATVAAWTPMRLTFAGFGVFPGEPAVLWLVPTPSAELSDRQARISGLRPTAVVHPRYRPGAWVPHVTLVEDLTLVGAIEALLKCSLDWEPFVADLDQIELVSFAPVSVLWSNR
jgi:2'-5' RNA ligase